MKRRDNIDRMKALMEDLRKRDKKVSKKKDEPKIDADVNKDGKVDEKDLSIVHKAFSAAKKATKKKSTKKKIVKKDD